MSPQIYEAVGAYELHLRYYVQALRYAGFPHAYHTIGSCMAVRADSYRKQGGMNKRKAGEDFYFLHKVIPLGGFTDLTGTTVIPSARPSDRVPFGTGKAVRSFLEGQEIKTYPLEAFLDLQCCFERVAEIYQREKVRAGEKLEGLPVSMRDFFAEQRFAEALYKICENTSSEAAFRKRFFRWFDGFRAMKSIHQARDRCYGEGRVGEQAARLLARLTPGRGADVTSSLRDLLQIYRELDRGGSANSGRLP